MSLLLDALKSTDSISAATIEPQAMELQDIELQNIEPPDAAPGQAPLDGPAILELLSPKSAHDTAAPTSNAAMNPATAAGAEAVAGIARAPPIYSRPPLVLAARVREPAAATPEPAARATNARVPPAAPAMQQTKKYGLLLLVVVALVGIGTFGKSLLWPSKNAPAYPQGGETQQPLASVSPTPTPVSAQAVQVAAVRPADHFAYTGDAPEIDLHDPGVATNVTRNPSSPVSRASVIVPAPARASRAAVATLSVTRSEGLSSIDRHVLAGYRALAAGNVASAQTEYLAALALDSNNVDALMGAANAAARDGEPAVAAAAYAKALRLEPGNPDATAALAMLKSGGTANEPTESRLKILIAGDDGSRPALHAALAGVYAADARWTEAAQEYFTALGKDPGNPDLAFNVAASLDQNRNPAMALVYYQQTLAFALKRPAQIDLHAVELRISQLQARARPSQSSSVPAAP
jgi:Tfp pilus assembly protein PilF